MKKLLEDCEDWMWKSFVKEGKKKKGQKMMGAESGRAFIDAIFARDKNLEQTENLMQRIRLWSMRFDANCEPVFKSVDNMRKRSK